MEGLREKIVLNDTIFPCIDRLQSPGRGIRIWSPEDLLSFRNHFQLAQRPVSYPFLWDIAHSDYVQWNGLANNAESALGRNAGEVIGVFGILDWGKDTSCSTPTPGSTPSLPGRAVKRQERSYRIRRRSRFNLQRLESSLKLKSPQMAILQGTPRANIICRR
jgi:hypothetical protein